MSIQYCRHIRVNGERCGAPALRSEFFCYFHMEIKRRHRGRPHPDPEPNVLHPLALHDGNQPNPILAEPTQPFSDLELPELEDRHSIQVALSLIITALAQNRIDPKRAALLFYGLQVASSNAHRLNPVPKTYLGKVSLTVTDQATGHLIAPEGDPEDPKLTAEYEKPGSATQYWNKLQAEAREEERLKAITEAQLDADLASRGLKTNAQIAAERAELYAMPLPPPLF
jgi:hypothetical protein